MKSEQDEPLPTKKAKEGELLPQIGLPVWVQCDGYRTMAFRDARGVWRTVAREQELKGMVKVIRN